MTESILFQLAGVLVLGVTAQWLAWRLGLPSILLLLTFGLVAGPVRLWLRPNALFGDLLLPAVSLAVALILYEGGLTLRLSELSKVGAVVRNLVTIGALVTWLVATCSGYLILGLSMELSALLGAVLVVTGPTVIVPMLRQIRPSGSVGSVLKWEGIVIDPIGAVSAVLVFEVIGVVQHAAVADTAAHIVWGVLRTIVFGGGIGLAAAGLLVLLLARYWVADYLQNAASLMFVIAAFAASNHFQPESGLLAATVMGFALANQRWVDVQHIAEFKENLQVLLIACLFIVLGARLERAQLETVSHILGRAALFVGVLVLVARPLSVVLSTMRSGLSWQERAFMCWMAPRGVVAAAVASVFAIELRKQGTAGAELLVPVTFFVIIATVALYGLTSALVARRLGVAESSPQGLLIVGAHALARNIGEVLKEKGFRVLLVDSNRENVNAARMAGLPTHAGSILAEQTLDELELGGVGRLLAMTPNDWVNALAVHRFVRVFGRANCYQLAADERAFARRERHAHLHGRPMFQEGMTFARLEALCARGFGVKATRLSEEFDYKAYRKKYGDSALPLFVLSEKGRLRVRIADAAADPAPGETVVGLVEERSG